MATAKKTHYVIDGPQEDYDDAGSAPFSDDVQAEYDDAALCPACGELIAWHEAACVSSGEQQAPTETLEALSEMKASSSFAYGLGHRVQPVTLPVAYPIIWRGQVRERHPRTGLVHRVNVYRLDNGFWDCYYEEELLAA